MFRLHVRLHLHLHTCFKLHEFVARKYHLCAYVNAQLQKKPTPTGLKQCVPFQSKELPAGCTLRDPDMGGAVDFIRTHFIQQLWPQKSWGRGFSGWRIRDLETLEGSKRGNPSLAKFKGYFSGDFASAMSPALGVLEQGRSTEVLLTCQWL